VHEWMADKERVGREELGKEELGFKRVQRRT